MRHRALLMMAIAVALLLGSAATSYAKHPAISRRTRNRGEQRRPGA